MRAAWLLLPLALTSCKREPSFEERYDNAQAAILNTSAELDEEMRAMEGNGADTGQVTQQRSPPGR